MFLIFINELVFVLEQLNIKVKLFADDAKMYVRILDDTDVVQLQTALDALSHWAENWQLSISINKCCILFEMIKLVINGNLHLDFDATQRDFMVTFDVLRWPRIKLWI